MTPAIIHEKASTITDEQEDLQFTTFTMNQLDQVKCQDIMEAIGIVMKLKAKETMPPDLIWLRSTLELREPVTVAFLGGI